MAGLGGGHVLFYGKKTFCWPVWNDLGKWWFEQSYDHHSMDWFKGKSTGNYGFYMFLPLNMGVSCKFSLKPIHWIIWFGHFWYEWSYCGKRRWWETVHIKHEHEPKQQEQERNTQRQRQSQPTEHMWESIDQGRCAAVALTASRTFSEKNRCMKRWSLRRIMYRKDETWDMFCLSVNRRSFPLCYRWWKELLHCWLGNIIYCPMCFHQMFIFLFSI